MSHPSASSPSRCDSETDIEPDDDELDLASQIAARERELREELAVAEAEEHQLEKQLALQRDKIAASHASRLFEFQSRTRTRTRNPNLNPNLTTSTSASTSAGRNTQRTPELLLVHSDDIGRTTTVEEIEENRATTTTTTTGNIASTAISSFRLDHSIVSTDSESESEIEEMHPRDASVSVSASVSSSKNFSIHCVRGTRRANATVISLSSSDGEEDPSDGDEDTTIGGGGQRRQRQRQRLREDALGYCEGEGEEEEGETDEKKTETGVDDGDVVVVRRGGVKDFETETETETESESGILGGLRRLFGWIGRRRTSESSPGSGKTKIRVPDPAERLELEKPRPRLSTGPSATNRQSELEVEPEVEVLTPFTAVGSSNRRGRKKRKKVPTSRTTRRHRKGGFLGSLSSRDFREALRESGATSVILETSAFSDWKKNSLMTWAETIGVEGLPQKIEELDIRTHLDLLRFMIRRPSRTRTRTGTGTGVQSQVRSQSEHEIFFDGISEANKFRTLLNFHLVHRNNRFDPAFVRIVDKLAKKPGFVSTRLEDTTMYLYTILLPSELRKMIVSTFESERRPVPVKVVAVNHDVLSKLGLQDTMQIPLHRREMRNYLSGPISTALVVGNMLIEWNQSGICSMKAISTDDSGFFLSVAEGLLPCLVNMEQEAALGLLESTNDDPHQMYQDRLERLGSVIVSFNKDEVYDPNQKNSQQFVSAALMALALTTGMRLTCEGVMSVVLSEGCVSHLPFELKRVRDWGIQDLLMWFEVIGLRKTFTTRFEFDLDATRMFHSDLDKLAKHLICKTRGSSRDRVFFRLQYYCLMKFFECEVLVKRDHLPVLKKLNVKVQTDKVMKKSDCYTVPCMVFPPIAMERFFGDHVDRLDVKIILLEDAVDFGKGSAIRFVNEKLLNMHPALLVNDSVLMDWVCPGLAIPRQVVWRIQLPQLELFSIRSIPAGRGDATRLLEKLLAALTKWNITMRFGDPSESGKCGNPMTFIEDILREIGIADFVEAVGDSSLLQKLRRDGRVSPLRFEPGSDFCRAFGLDTDREFQFSSHVALDSFVLSLASETSKNLQQFPLEYKMLRIIDRVFWFRKMWDTERGLTDEATLFHPMTEEREGEQPEVCLCPFSNPFEAE